MNGHDYAAIAFTALALLWASFAHWWPR